METEEEARSPEEEEEAIIETGENGAAADAATVEMINHIAYNYVALFIVAVGIIGNILNLIVLTRPKLKGVM